MNGHKGVGVIEETLIIIITLHKIPVDCWMFTK
jgi:hypothetical protein